MSDRTVAHALRFIHTFGGRLFPLRERDKVPALRGSWKDLATSDPEQIKAWFGNGSDYNIAVRTGQVSGFWVLDIDGVEGEAMLAGLCDVHDDLDTVLDQTLAATTGRGHHYYFAYDPRLDGITSITGLVKGIDVKCNDGYVVMPPSIHPSGAAYTWVPHPDEDERRTLQPAPEWLVEMILDYRKIPERKRTPPALPSGEDFFADTDTTKNVAVGGRNNALAQYAGELAGRGLGEAEIAVLVLARNAEFDEPLAESEIERTVLKSTGQWVERKQEEIEEGESQDDAIVNHLNTDWFETRRAGRTVICRVEDCEDYSYRTDWEARVNADHDIWLPRTLKGASKPKNVGVGTIWLNSPRRRTHTRLGFDPGAPPQSGLADGSFNRWRGFAVDPIYPTSGALPVTIEPWLTHVYETICSGNDEHYEYMRNLLAALVQQPGKLWGVTPVLFSETQGTGKNIFADPVRALFGSHGLTVDDADLLTGRFSGHLETTVALVADESFFGKSGRQRDKMKSLITNATRTYEAKGKDPRSGRNYLHTFILSNNPQTVSVEYSDRRFFALEVSDAYANNTAHFNKISRALGWRETDGIPPQQHTGLGDLLGYLLSLDVSSFDAMGSRPRTIALASLQEDSLNLYEQFAVACIEDGVLPRASTSALDGGESVYLTEWDTAIGSAREIQLTVVERGLGEWMRTTNRGSLRDGTNHRVALGRAFSKMLNRSYWDPVGGSGKPSRTMPTLVEARRLLAASRSRNGGG